MERKKKGPKALKVDACSDQKPPKASLKKRRRPGGSLSALEGQKECEVACKWLHVNDDGSEEWYRSEPSSIKTLKVEFIDIGGGRLVQHTVTRDLPEEIMYGGAIRVRTVRPRGKGWEVWGSIRNRVSDWRRPHKGGVP